MADDDLELERTEKESNIEPHIFHIEDFYVGRLDKKEVREERLRNRIKCGEISINEISNEPFFQNLFKESDYRKEFEASHKQSGGGEPEINRIEEEKPIELDRNDDKDLNNFNMEKPLNECDCVEFSKPLTPSTSQLKPAWSSPAIIKKFKQTTTAKKQVTSKKYVLEGIENVEQVGDYNRYENARVLQSLESDEDDTSENDYSSSSEEISVYEKYTQHFSKDLASFEDSIECSKAKGDVAKDKKKESDKKFKVSEILKYHKHPIVYPTPSLNNPIPTKIGVRNKGVFMKLFRVARKAITLKLSPKDKAHKLNDLNSSQEIKTLEQTPETLSDDEKTSVKQKRNLTEMFAAKPSCSSNTDKTKN